MVLRPYTVWHVFKTPVTFVPLRIGSRSGHSPFDWKDRETWLPSLNELRKPVTYYPDLCVPGALETVQSFFVQAVNAGVKKMVFLSGRGEVEAEQAERALKAAVWTGQSFTAASSPRISARTFGWIRSSPARSCFPFVRSKSLL
jgi:hypothetical protein